MTIQELGSLGEFVSSLGVMIALIYLIVEVRRNTRATVETSKQWSFERFSSARSLIASNPELAECVEKAIQNEDLSAAEIRQVEAYLNEFGFCVVYFLNSEEASRDDESRRLSESTLDFYVSMLDNTVGRRFIGEQPFPERFKESVEQKLANRRSDA